MDSRHYPEIGKDAIKGSLRWTGPKAAPHERAVRLAEALTTLPENQREAVVLRHWHDCSLVEIGERLGCTTAAVTGLLHRGLRNLRKHLHDLE